MTARSPSGRVTSADARSARIAALSFDYAAQPKHTIEACNLCGDTRFVVVAHRDRYGFPAEAHGCLACGLVFLNPVMTAEAYRAFYADTYRPLVSAYHGRLIDAMTIQAEQREYAGSRAAFLAPFVASRRLRTLLDVGGSTGVVAARFAEEFGLSATVLDPSPSELAEARRRGLATIAGLLEEVEPDGREFDVVVLCQTIDHVLDVAGALDRVRRWLTADGLLFLDIVDFRAAYLRNRSVEDAIKIDHPFSLTEGTMTAFLARAGFQVLRVDYAADHLHVGYVCARAAREARLPDGAAVERLWAEIRGVQNGWGPSSE